MKRNLIFAIVLAAFITVPAMAVITVEETTDAECMINNGFSQAMAEDVFMMKNRVLNKPIEPLYEKSQNVLVRGWRKFYSYLDPTQDTYDRLHHDIKRQPSFSDL